MSVITSSGQVIQYDAEDLIIRLKEDIKKYGFGKRVRVWCWDTDGIVLYLNYNYIEEEPMLRDIDIEHGVYFKKMAMGELLPLFEKRKCYIILRKK